MGGNPGSRKDTAVSARGNNLLVAEQTDQLLITDLTYISIWQDFAYAAFIINTFTGRIVRWQVSIIADGNGSVVMVILSGG